MGGLCSCCTSRPKRTTFVALAPSSSHGLVGVEILEGRNCSRAIEEKIEHSKSHWSLLSEFELGLDEVVEVNNVEVFQALQSHHEWGSFFVTFGEGGMGKLVMGKKFAEGGQAKLYDAHIEWNDPEKQEDDLQLGTKWVLKVFKMGTSLQQLQLQWPYGLLQDHVERKEWQAQGTRPKLPEYVDGWMRELLRRCWESNPVDRPSFGEILEILVGNSEACREIDAHRKKHEVDIAMGIFKRLKSSFVK